MVTVIILKQIHVLPHFSYFYKTRNDYNNLFINGTIIDPVYHIIMSNLVTRNNTHI